jgi:hypothetical protein
MNWSPFPQHSFRFPNQATITAASVTAVIGLASTVAGQSLNIDFGTGHGAPAPTFAAAGLPGVWNAIEVPISKKFPPPPLETVALVDLAGLPTTATISADPIFATLSDIPLAHPELTGDLQALLGDALLGPFGPKSPITITLNGLQDGTYRLITYTWYWPAEQFAILTVVDPESERFIWPAGGPWPGGLVLGVTHMSNAVAVNGGVLSFVVGGSGIGSFFNGDSMINGLQLWKIDEPQRCPADLSGDQQVNGFDLAMLLAAWGKCPQCLTKPCPCPADLSSDGQVNGFDLALLLGEWGPCTAPPPRCGDRGLGDCYIAHPGGGCTEAPCCNAICAVDPYCCESHWDEICVGLANLNGECAEGVHPNCGNPEATACDTAAGTPGCSDSTCCATVCDIDPYCCAYAWDGICVAEAALYCSKIPAGCGHPGAGGCFHWFGGGNPTPFCDDAECCEAVCAIDDYCCTVQWDTVCVATAEAVCAKGSCGPEAGSCFVAHPATAGCDDSACCATVCAIVPTCCDVESFPDGGWTTICVDWAQKLCRKTAK